MAPNKIFTLSALAVLLLLIGGCGYYNPNMLPADEEGPPILLNVPVWANQTNEIGLESVIHNTLSDWLIQNKQIVLTKTRDQAEYELSGRIVSVSFPGLSYSSSDQATALKAVLNIHYAVIEIKTGKTINQRNYSLDEPFQRGASSMQTDENKEKALQSLADDLAENIYIRVYRELNKHKHQTKAKAGADTDRKTGQ